ncbi:MAG: hypothetical protein ACOY2B_00595 [Pseudomonadota bacterium]
MASTKNYQVHTSSDDLENLKEVLETVASGKGHVRIIGVTWRPERGASRAGYTIISESDA